MSRNRSVMSHSFATTPKADIQRSSFDRSHGYKTTFDSGLLIPIYWDEALPGDTFNLKMTAFARLATPLKPIMDNLFLESFFFAVPVRQIWTNWTKFNGEQDDPGDSVDFTVPVIQLNHSTDTAIGNIYDYAGIPFDPAYNITHDINALHFRAHNHIYNNWFRDQNLIPSLPVPKDDGPDPASNYTIQRRRKRPDYFTSALPFPQKGTEVTIPILGTAPVTTDAAITSQLNIAAADGTSTFMNTDDVSGRLTVGSPAFPVNSPMYADLTLATGVSINDQRQAFQVQRMFERDARSGTRYPEILLAHFHVSDPMMLVHQRPEFLGGSTTMIQINPVPQQSDSGSDVHTSETPQGNLAAFGTAHLKAHGFVKSFTEHTLLIGYINVRADLTYQSGLERMWTRQTRFDFFWPALAHLGEQTILQQEIYFTDSAAENDDVWGYQERFSEYRHKLSQITGLFRSTAAASLDVWHLSQVLPGGVTLGKTFIEDAPPIDRIIAVQSEPEFLLDAYFNLRCARPMPIFGTPGMMDHF